MLDQHSVLWSGDIRLAHTDLWTKVALCLQGLVLSSGLSYPKGLDFFLFPQREKKLFLCTGDPVPSLVFQALDLVNTFYVLDFHFSQKY